MPASKVHVKVNIQHFSDYQNQCFYDWQSNAFKLSYFGPYAACNSKFKIYLMPLYLDTIKKVKFCCWNRSLK